jgi:DNA polymerase epsilon subunit 1
MSSYRGRGGRGGGRERSVLHTGGGGGGGGGSWRGGGRGGWRGGRGGGSGGGSGGQYSKEDLHRSMLSTLRQQARDADQEFDARSGYVRLESGPPRVGYLFNAQPAALVGEEDRLEHSAMDLYFLQQDGDTFKATVAYEPYFYLLLASHTAEREVVAALERRFEGLASSVSIVERDDLEMPNHLAGHKRRLVMLTFRSVNELQRVRNQLRPIVEKNGAALLRGESLEVRATGRGRGLGAGGREGQGVGGAGWRTTALQRLSLSLAHFHRHALC